MLGTSQTGLSERQINDFQRNGFVGPLPAYLTMTQIDTISEKLKSIVNDPSPHPLYGRFSVRDWHLLIPEVMDMVTHPVIVGALRSLAGENLNLWRSKIFHKAPHSDGTGWHQEWGDFNGEEVGNNKPSLKPAKRGEDWWNLTVWIALSDIGINNAPMKFIKGSQKTRFPIRMAPMTQSESWHDPFVGCESAKDIYERSQNFTLILDVDTSAIFRDVNIEEMTLQEAKDHVLREVEKMPAAEAMSFDDDAPDVAILPMKQGEFIIFTERAMHGSLPNNSDEDRLAFNFRVTTTDTEVYPSKRHGDFIDGSNLDISKHRCVLLSGADLSGGFNKYFVDGDSHE